ncbi:PREDICTED: filament-like plant protein 5 [Tarenaya hassleriana]|uniref:filament-like plant protein 5 n=1 Tax=Tarenaya hassleriana TaxID=28532 RepID=UPI00053C4D84|nr:PREDICTED: filament-like plant protein 5 [Tarenaya hassleriana]XP_010548295.1 PREDICTED: filament-like plant protein 5 [Tarenaya hassleriana]
MEGRVWPWKRKSSDKTTTEKPVVAACDSVGVSLSSLASLENQEKCKNTNYVQITMESYTHMGRLGDQVKLLEDEVKDLKEKLSTAHSEIKTKESLILQHAKVAEEAVSGWEKADAETLALKWQLESVTLLKLTAEDRVLHLDDALKECTRQIRNVKDESEQRLHDVILAKTVQWDKTKAELEGQIDELNQGLLRAAADNAALSRSLQERSEMIIRISGEKSKADTEVEILKSNIQSYEKEISSLKYDLHVVSKELEIRNEEKNMSIKSAEMANRQHLEGVKKIAKLEAECQRLRGLVRKKLPGPAALAQMKLEIENSGYEFADSRSRRSGFQYPGHNAPPKPDISADKLECKKDNTHFSRCMLEMEEETKTLKELLAARNSELQVSRNLCAKTLGKLKILEAHVEMLKHDKITPKSCKTNQSESPSSGHATYPPSATSISEDGFDEDGSSSEYGPPMSSDSNKVAVSRSINSSNKPETSNRLELMDDFLEIERLAASDADGAVSASNSSNSTCSSKVIDKLPASDSEQDRAQAESSMENIKSSAHDQLFSVIHSRIYKVFESQEGISVKKVIEAVKLAIQEVQESSSQQLSGCLIDISCIDAFPRAGDETGKEHSLLSQNIERGNNVVKPTKQDLDAAISHIHRFIISAVKETAQLHEMHEQGLSESLDDFCASVGKFPTGESSLVDIVIKLSHILRLATDGSLGFKHHSNESSAMDSTVSECVDKVTLLEKRVDELNSDASGKIFIDRAGNPCSKEEIPHDNNGLDLDDTSCKSLLQELEQVKLEKDNVLLELERCLQKLESSKPELEEKEKLISELKSQLTSSRDLLGLAETQLKCVTESFKSLELRAEDLEAEVRRLQLRTEDLEVSLSKEKHGHACTLAVCKELQEKMQRNDTCRKCSSPMSQTRLQDKQEKEIASAAEKLAACQETIHLLSQQLQALKPPTKSQSPEKLKTQVNSEGYSPELRERDGKESINDILASTGHENTSDSASNDSDMARSFRYRADSAQPVHAIIKSSSFSSSSKGENEKYTRGLGRFFSSKTKSGR